MKPQLSATALRPIRNNGFVQVIVYADRVEVWNPGELPPGLTPELLRQPHGPIPRNPLLAEPLFRVKLVEKAGTGTTDMIADCREAGLPEPDFEQHGPHFVTTLWRDWLTGDAMGKLGLNERQKLAIAYIKTHRRISNPEYQQLTKATKKTATRDLVALAKSAIVKQVGTRGPGVHYVLARSRDTIGTMGT